MRSQAAITFAITALALTACDNRQNTNYPGGGGSGAASNADPALLRMAQQALPVTRGLERCRAAYGSYPPNADATIGCLPGGAPIKRQGSFVVVGDWTISPDNTGVGYTMTRQIDAKAMLVRRCVRQSCRWIYDPGDGRPSQEMNLGA
jgi:hypothetical protein